jgi:hypothetical protein
MSWRETLGVTQSAPHPEPYAHNSHNSQKPAEISQSAGFADCADFAVRDIEESDSQMLEALADACRGLAITPGEVREALGPEGAGDWQAGALTTSALAVFARLVSYRKEMDQGIRPSDFSKAATCAGCGPVWLRHEGEVLGCPWCWNRVADRPIPRPVAVRCRDCVHFKRADHPHLGHCIKGLPEPVAGLWDLDFRNCERFLPLPSVGRRVQAEVGLESRQPTLEE